MKIKLLTNFHDYYDHHFDLDGYVFDRRDNIGMSRPEMFEFFKEKNIDCARNGLVKNLIPKIKKDWDDIHSEAFQTMKPEIVVYLDNNSHRGENKILLECDEALEKYPDYYSSEFMPSCQNYKKYAISYRSLIIGNCCFFLKYSSESWKSNCGNNLEIEILRKYNHNLNIKYPIFAIDCIKFNNKYIAIDFNQSPRIEGTGIEDILKPKDVRNLIEEYYKTIS